MSKISAVRARAISIPLDSATSFASRLVKERHYGIVEVSGDDGFKGIGFCYVGSSGGSIFPEIVTSLLAPVLLLSLIHILLMARARTAEILDILVQPFF